MCGAYVIPQLTQFSNQALIEDITQTLGAKIRTQTKDQENDISWGQVTCLHISGGLSATFSSTVGFGILGYLIRG